MVRELPEMKLPWNLQCKKKKRRGGNDSIGFLREKSQPELDFGKSELELKEKETVRSFE